MKLFEAFEALDALNEETFTISDDGVEKLGTFMSDNDNVDDIVDVIDPEAETEEELKDSYVGKVILDCCVCHSKLYKDKEDVTLDEEGTLANVGEDCPFCYTSDGFKVVGEVAPFADEDEDTDDVKEEEEVVEESLTEAVATLEKPMSAFAGTLSNVMTAHQNELAAISSKHDALAFLNYIEPEVKNKSYLATVKEKVAKLPDFKVLTFLYNIILKGDGMGSKLESLTESHRGDRHRVTAELFDILSENGFDTDAEDVEDYVFAARDLVFEEVLADPSKSIREIVEQWFADTKANYPEDLESLTRFEEGIFGIKTKKEKEKEAKAKAEKERQKQRDKELKDQEERARQQAVADSWARHDKAERDAQKEYNRNRSTTQGSKISNTGKAGVHYSGGDYYTESKSIKETVDDKPKYFWYVGSNGVGHHYDDEKTAINVYDKLVKDPDIAKDLEVLKCLETPDEVKVVEIIRGNSVDESKSINEELTSSFDDGELDDELHSIESSIKDIESKLSKLNKRKSHLNTLKDEQIEITNLLSRLFNDFNCDMASFNGTNGKYSALIKGITSADLKSVPNLVHEDNKFVITLDEYTIEMTPNNKSYVYVTIDKKLQANESKSINEDINNLSLDTDDTHMEMTSDENGKVTITSEPIENTKVESEETIVPVSPELEAEIVEEPAEKATEEEVDIEEFDEASFDELGESYLKSMYENVESFKTTDVSTNDSTLFVEGLITFTSGNAGKTSFEFSAKDFLKEGIYRFIGSNKELSEGKTNFELTGKITDKKFICESLTTKE